MSRRNIITSHVNDVMGQLLDESREWVMPPNEPCPEWEEMRDAIQAYLFLIERECGRQEQFARKQVTTSSAEGVPDASVQ